MNVFLIRHAHAGQRKSDSHDIYRPLSPKGRDRAQELAAVFKDHKIDAVLSSTATRCVQTVQPLAAVHGLTVQECEELWEDATAAEAIELIERHVGGNGLIVSSHGNIIPEILERLADDGVPLDGAGCQKGSVWALDYDGSRFVKGLYLSKKGALLAEGR